MDPFLGSLISADFLLRFSEHFPYAITVKNIQEGQRIQDMKIVLYNAEAARFYGLESEGMENKTAPEVLEYVDLPDREGELKRIEKTEQEAIANNHQSIYTQILLDINGFIRIRQKITTPVCGKRNSPIAIASIFRELTPYVSLPYLLRLYKKFYRGHKSTAVEKLSNHLKLKKFFIETLTYMELFTLLAMTKDARHKSVALLLENFRQKPILSTTISSYVDTMKDKLKPNIDLHMVLSNLRARGEWIPEHGIY